MITAADLEYHHSDTADHTWAETYYLPISVPEERLFAHVYVVVRPVLGTMQNDIRVHGSVSSTEFELLYIDSQNHLPAPERFSQLHGPNGLSVVAVNPPRDYRVDYVGRDGTEIHVDMIGIMQPFDINDPAENPFTGTTEEEKLANTSMGSGYKGHYDMHCRVTGTLKVRGKEYAVDIVDRMNHSWGPRPEMEIPPMNSVWAQFGEDLGLRFHMHLDPAQETGQDQRFANGYVLDKGEVFAIKDLDMTTTRVGIVPVTIDVEATDIRDKKFRLRGVPIAGGPWRAYAPCICWIGLIQWEHNGVIGHGSIQENHALGVETRLRGRRWSDRIAALTA
ncbi:hypothetical protein [Streptomyces sp. NPDC058424]|uniref:DUF7064 domain-containing protein n=1 Tax=Streptomyces sp. NPDC058424 TaxID=3346491 RepID=UPI00365A29F8